ncbi:MAG: hypothetical protein JO083_10655 [Candidatus Eremiobacteraeota bacterium]|nr:hypothetical protein [Candidatus Eremiobacteraeota bacterium]
MADHSAALYSASTQHSTLSASEVSRAIDPSITGPDRDQLLGVIANSAIRKELSNSARRVVVVLYDPKERRFLSNRVGIAEKFEALDPLPGTNNLYESRNGHEIVGPGPSTRPAPSSGPGTISTSGRARTTLDYYPVLDNTSGPYRRIYTSPNRFETGTTWASNLGENATAQLPPCGSARYAAGTRDAGYVYMGGWGSFGASVDAGVYHMLPVNGQDVYQEFMNINGHFLQTYEDIEQHTTGFPTFNCGTVVSLNFTTGSSADGTTLTILLGVNGIYIGYLDNLNTLSSFGWSQVCQGCVLKRMTSIAQPSQDLKNGDKFGPVLWNSATVICDVGSQGCTLQANATGAAEGFSEPYNASPWKVPIIGGCMEWPQWSATGYPPPYPSDCSGSPSGAPIQVNFSDTANEIDTIALPSPTPAPSGSPRSPTGCGKNTCL